MLDKINTGTNLIIPKTADSTEIYLDSRYSVQRRRTYPFRSPYLPRFDQKYSPAFNYDHGSLFSKSTKSVKNIQK